MRLRLFEVALAVLMCTGCASTRDSARYDADADYRPAEHPGKGLVIVSTRLSTDCRKGENPSARLWYRDSPFVQRPTSVIPVNDPVVEQAFQAPPGHFSVKELFEGKYQVQQLEIRRTPHITKDTEIPFEVETGKAVYLGEIHVKLTHCDSIPVITTVVSDQWERDSKLFEQKMKNVRADEVVKRLLVSQAAAL
jgi:hypothetical protein